MKLLGFSVVRVAVRVRERRSPFARLVILVEAETHLIFDALMCPYKIWERVRALKLLRSVTPGMLLMWDRGLHSYAMVEATTSKGCEYLGRIPSLVKCLNETQLERRFSIRSWQKKDFMKLASAWVRLCAWCNWPNLIHSSNDMKTMDDSDSP